MTLRKIELTLASLAGAALICGSVWAATNADILTGQAAFSDFRGERPGATRKITPVDLPKPYATSSARNQANVVARPAGAMPIAPPGFTVQLYVSRLGNPREIRTAPNGDLFVADSDAGEIEIFRGASSGKPDTRAVFATGLQQPFGMAFYPPGPKPQWLYVGNTGSVVRIPYKNGDMKASGKPEHYAGRYSQRGGPSRWAAAIGPGSGIFARCWKRMPRLGRLRFECGRPGFQQR